MIMSDSESRVSSRPASWRDLPRKDQLAVLAICRVVDFLQIASFQTISYYQLKSFDPSLPEETLSWQTGVAQASFTASQFFTAILWGYIADRKWCGRKNVLLFGLVGTGLSCSALAFSKHFLWMVVFRALGGASNGTVGVVFVALPC
jgi:MFS family permease